MAAIQETPSARENAMAMGPYMICEDPPHYLSAVGFKDIPEMVRVLNINKDVYNGTSSFEYPYLESHAQARVARAVANTAEKGYNTRWAMRTSPEGPLIGWIHTHSEPTINEVHPETSRPLKVTSIGYWVSPEYTRKGYAGRSARFVTQEILFKELDYDIVRGESYLYNTGSRKAMEGAGMVLEMEAKSVFIQKLQEERNVCCYAAHRDNSTRSVITKPRA
ncbi:hypothetical protein EDD21DRAFT_165320 [Dissophora ornata]|nr:hypothetical protein BGZ58_007822 [Dissophora ornata]KAI8599230.1 hypothetical protein EDD21DRAFT_165320 [Dissophora ornata]